MTEKVNMPLYVKAEGTPYMLADVSHELLEALKNLKEGIGAFAQRPIDKRLLALYDAADAAISKAKGAA